MVINIPLMPTVCRGQVWFVRQPEEVTDAITNNHHSVAMFPKTRPYLIVSDQSLLDRREPVIYGLPITTSINEEDENGIVIRYRKYQNASSPDRFMMVQIMLNVLTPLKFEQLSGYVYSVTPEIMEYVDSKIGLQIFGNDVSVSKIVKDLHDMEKKIHNIGYIMDKFNSILNTEVELQHPNRDQEKIQKIENTEVYTSTKSVPSETTKKTPEKSNKPIKKPSIKTPKTNNSKKTYFRWNEKTIAEFNHDDHTLSYEGMCKKYGFSSRRDYTSRKNYIEHRLNDILNKKK